MLRKRSDLHRVALGLLALAAVVTFSGCSSVEPGDTWADATGRVAGTVRSDGDEPLTEFEVWLWAELGPEGREVAYQTYTDQYGEYSFDSVEMASQHSFEATYWLCANRTPERAEAIAEEYASYFGTVTVPKGGEYTADLELDYVGDEPDDPESYVEG